MESTDRKMMVPNDVVGGVVIGMMVVPAIVIWWQTRKKRKNIRVTLTLPQVRTTKTKFQVRGRLR